MPIAEDRPHNAVSTYRWLDVHGGSSIPIHPCSPSSTVSRKGFIGYTVAAANRSRAANTAARFPGVRFKPGGSRYPRETVPGDCSTVRSRSSYGNLPDTRPLLRRRDESERARDAIATDRLLNSGGENYFLEDRLLPDDDFGSEEKKK